MRKTSVSIISLVFSAVILVVISSSKVSCDSATSSTEQSILGTLQSVQEVEVGKLLTLFAVDEKIFANSVNIDDSTNTLKVYDASTMEELWRVDDSWFVYRGCEGNRPCIIMKKIVGEGRANYRIYNVDGNVLFTLENFEGTLFSSPNCQYIYSEFSSASYNPFRIFDANGTEISSRFNVRGVWSAYSFNDSIIVLSKSSEITFVSIRDGVIHKTIPSPDGQIGIDPDVAISPKGTTAVINWYLTTFFVDSTLNVLWQKRDKYAYFDAAIDSEEKLVACLLGKFDPASNGIKMKLTIIQSLTGKEIFNDEFLSAVPTGNFRNFGMRFTDHILSLTIPYSNYLDISNLDTNTHTRLYSINPNENTIGEVDVSSGIVEVLALGGKSAKVRYSGDKKNVLEISYWRNLGISDEK